jgi:hypothetical protein
MRQLHLLRALIGLLGCLAIQKHQTIFSPPLGTRITIYSSSGNNEHGGYNGIFASNCVPQISIFNNPTEEDVLFNGIHGDFGSGSPLNNIEEYFFFGTPSANNGILSGLSLPNASELTALQVAGSFYRFSNLNYNPSLGDYTVDIFPTVTSVRIATVEASPTSVPEPGSLAMLASAIGCFACADALG